MPENESQPAAEDIGLIAGNTGKLLLNMLGKVPVFTIVLVFLYVCGGISLFTYWRLFGINMAELVNIGEIPKSFIIPFLMANFIYVAYWYWSKLRWPFMISNANTPGVITKSLRIMSFHLTPTDFWIIVVTGLLLNIQYFPPAVKQSQWSWLFIGMMLMVVLCQKVFHSLDIKRGMKGFLTQAYVVIILVATPVFSFTYAMMNGVRIYTNKSIQLVTIIEKESAKTGLPADSVSLKLLGFIGDKVIISTLDNKKRFIINQSAADKIIVSDNTAPQP